MNIRHIEGEEVFDDIVRVDPPSETDQEFTVVASESATPETHAILKAHGKDWTLKARSYRPAVDKFFLLMRSKKTEEAFWLPEDETLLLTHY